MKIKERFFGLISIIFLIIFMSGYALAQEVGKITALQGKVDVLKEGKLPAIVAKVNLPVYLKDIIRTKTDSKAEITFKDGTVVRVAPRSRVDISEYFTDAETLRASIDVPRGKVAAYVSEESTEKIRKAPKANRFEIKTPIAVAGVRGTSYMVAHYPAYSTVTVITGKVYCYNPQFPERVVEVSAGQMTVIREQAPPMPPRKLTPKEIEREQREVVAGKEEAPKAEAPKVVEVAPPAVEKEAATPVEMVTAELPKETVTETIIETTPPITETTTIPLTMNVDLLSIEPGSIYLNYKVEANRNITVRYRIMQDGSYSDWTTVNTVGQNPVYVSVPVSPGLGSQIQIEAKDNLGYSQTWESGIINPRLKGFSGSIHTTSTGSVSGAVASAIGYNKGVAKLNVSGSVPAGSFQSAGGDESGFFVYSGSHTGGGNFDTTFKLLTTTHLFSGSGNSVANLSASKEIISLTTAPSISVEPLNFSTNFNGMFHYYDGSKINEVSGTWAKFLFGRTGTLQFPSEGFVGYYTDNYLVGLENSTNDNHVFWGNWNSNSNSVGRVKGYGAGFLKEGLDPEFALYGLYIAPDGTAGVVAASYGAGFLKELHERGLYIAPGDSQYLSYVGGFNSLTDLEFEKIARGHPSSDTWKNYIEGSYQGFFIEQSGCPPNCPTISQQNINNTSFGVISSATLSLGGGTEPWGVFGIEVGGSHSSTNPTGFVIEFGGESWDNRDASSDTPDFWVGNLNNTTISNGKMYGEFSGKFLNPTHYGYIEGDMLGQFNSNNWVGVVIGDYYPVLELKHLSYSDSGTNDTKIYQNNFSLLTDVKIHGYLGGDEFWSKSLASLYAIGKFDSGIDFSQGKGYVYYASPDCYSCPSGIAYDSFMAGRAAQRTDGKYNINAYIAGVYQDGTNKGIFIGNLSDDGTPNVLQLEKRFFMEGENTVKAVTLDTGTISPTTVGLDTAYFSSDGASPEGIILSNKESSFIFDSSRNFGVGFIGTGGDYSTAPTSSWYISYNYNPNPPNNNFYFGAITQNNNPWGNDGDVQNVIKGKTYGYYADLNPSTPVTGIFVGETVGTFDPSNTTWQTVTVGAALETAKFLNMACPNGTCNTSGTGFTDEQEKLRKLNIPVVEVGSVNLSYSNSCTDCITNVNMNNVKFFASQTGQPPTIWATNNVSGQFNGTVSTSNYSVALTGGGFTVNFTPTVWDIQNNKWAANISGSGSLNIGGTPTTIQMKGVGAGGISGTNFSGTAAGHCH